MALVAGTVTVDANGVRTGSGYALDLYDAERASHPAPFHVTPLSAAVVESLQSLAAKCELQAAAFVAAMFDADVRVPANSLDSGVPTITRVLSGAVE